MIHNIVDRADIYIVKNLQHLNILIQRFKLII